MRNGGAAKTYLAVDLGAESGRAITGRLNSGSLHVEEVHRFPNEPVEYGGGLHWDAPRLWLEIQRALHMVRDTPLNGIAVDTWGVDYALLGRRRTAAAESLPLQGRANGGDDGGGFRSSGPR